VPKTTTKIESEAAKQIPRLIITPETYDANLSPNSPQKGESKWQRQLTEKQNMNQNIKQILVTNKEFDN